MPSSIGGEQHSGAFNLDQMLIKEKKPIMLKNYQRRSEKNSIESDAPKKLGGVKG
jgi:hypothetical protein